MKTNVELQKKSSWVIVDFFNYLILKVHRDI